MQDPCISTNYVDSDALFRYNFFKWLVPLLLAALLLGIIGRGCANASLAAPTLSGPEGTIDPGIVALSGTGAVGSEVEVRLGGRSIGRAPVNPDGTWTLDVDATEVDDYDFVAYAIDPDGIERGQSNALSFAVAAPIAFEAPTLSLPDGEIESNLVELTGTGPPGTRIEIFNNGEMVGTTTVGDDGRWRYETAVAQGDNEFQAFGLAPDGSDIGASDIQNLLVPVATADLAFNTPNLSDFHPTDGQTQATFALNGTGEPNSIVNFTIGDLAFGPVDVDADGNWSSEGELTLPPGNYEVAAEMTTADGTALGTFSRSDLEIPVLFVAPTLDRVDLVQDSGGVFSLIGTAAPGGEVQIVVDGEVVDTIMADASGNWSYNLSGLETGEHEVVARAAEDTSLASEVSSISVPIRILVGGVNVSEAGAESGVEIFGTAAPGAEMEIVVDGEVIGTVTADADGNWSLPTTLADGRYAILARLTGSPEQSDPQFFVVGEPSGMLTIGYADSASDPAGVGMTPVGAPAVSLILDASWSMTQPLGGSTRYAVAQQTVENIINSVLPADTPLALRIFGNLEGNLACRTDLMVPYGPLDRDEVSGVVNAARPQFNANTPLAESLALVAEDLAAATEEERIVVLLTDGEETCDGDPAAEIEKLAASGIDVQVNIVGLAIADEALKSEFERWAELGGGTYYDVSSADELSNALSESLLISYVVLDEAGEAVASGRVGGAPVEVGIGTYTIEVQTAPVQTLDAVTIETDETTALTLE